MNDTTTNSNPQVKVGDIFDMSWGYDQTNVEYFQVTRISKAGVFVREIGAKPVEGSEGFMCQYVMPVKDNFLTNGTMTGPGNPETFRRIKPGYKGTPSFNFKGRYFASLWDGKKNYNSWYA